MWSFYVPFNSHPYLRFFHHARGNSPARFKSPLPSLLLFSLFTLYLDPTGLYLSSLLNEEMTDLIRDLIRIYLTIRFPRRARDQHFRPWFYFLSSFRSITFNDADNHQIRFSETRVQISRKIKLIEAVAIKTSENVG